QRPDYRPRSAVSVRLTHCRAGFAGRGTTYTSSTTGDSRCPDPTRDEVSGRSLPSVARGVEGVGRDLALAARRTLPRLIGGPAWAQGRPDPAGGGGGGV